MKIFNREKDKIILQDTLDFINRLCSHSFNPKDFIITKSIGSVPDSIEAIEPIKGKPGKGQYGDYSVPILCEPGSKKYTQQITLKNASTAEEYYLRCIPAQVQLAMKIRRRGGRVDTGTRLEYLILEQGGPKAKQYEKIESFEYYSEYSHILKVDYKYYLKALVNALDQVFECTNLGKGMIKKLDKFTLANFRKVDRPLLAECFTLEQFKFRLIRSKLLDELTLLFNPKLIFVE